jgi:hypothetical protein
MYYYSPLDVSDFRRNFHFLFSEGKQGDDMAAALALGNIDSHRWEVVNKQTKAEMETFRLRVERLYGKDKFTPGALKTAFAYYNMITGKKAPPTFEAMQRGLASDMDRTLQVVGALDSMSKWGEKEYFRVLQLRLRYGVPPDLVEIIQIPGVGHVRANKLKAAKIKTLKDFLARDPDDLAKIMGVGKKVLEEAIDGARLIDLKTNAL